MCLAWWIRPAREQEAIIAQLREYDGRATVVYDDEYAGDSTASFPLVMGPIDFRPRAWMPSFVQSRLGKDYLYVVVSVTSPLLTLGEEQDGSARYRPATASHLSGISTPTLMTPTWNVSRRCVACSLWNWEAAPD